MRAEMLVEAVDVIRMLWEGGSQTYYGAYYTLENARIYTLPTELPPIMVAASGPKAAEVASEIGNGLISTAPKAELVEIFDASSSVERPHYGQVTVCCGEDEAEARRTAHKYWPNAGLHGELSQELATPAHFEQAVLNVSEEDVAREVVCGNDVEQHKQQIEKYIEAGFEHIYIHQVGPDQEAFFTFYERDILPAYS